MEKPKITIVVTEDDMLKAGLVSAVKPGCRCAMGHLLHALGVPDEILMGNQLASDLVSDLSPEMIQTLETFGLIDTDDPLKDGSCGWVHAIDTPVSDDIYIASDAGAWNRLTLVMLDLGVNFTVLGNPDGPPRHGEDASPPG